MFTPRLLQNLLLGLVTLLLGLGLLWAFVSGTRAGQSAIVLQNATALTTGVQYFFNDQNRYPTAVEFTDRNLMLNYFNNFPPTLITGGPCTETYNYSSATAKTFELMFCLPKATAGFIAGWNKVTQ